MDQSVTPEKDTTKLYAAAQAFADEIEKWEGEEELDRILSSFATKMLSPSLRAKLAFQTLANNTSCEEIVPETKKFGVDLGNEMGPDWAQWLYHFAVFVTKVA